MVDMLRSMTPRGYAAIVVALLPVAVLASCGEGGSETSSSDTITLYTCSSDETIQPIIEEFEAANEGSNVELFRAPTGELNARVAGDVRSGGLRADLIWTCDPLTMQDFVDQDLVGGFTSDNATAIPEEYRTEDYVGAALLEMVAVHGQDVPAPATWSDLTGAAYADGVAVPDPSFAASALGTLGYFSQTPDYGLDFYAALEQNGAVQVSTPDDVVAGVAEGVYKVGAECAHDRLSSLWAGSASGVSGSSSSGAK